MTHSTRHPEHHQHHAEPTPFVAYFIFALASLCLVAAIAIMWGITQDANWQGFGGVINVVGGL